MNLLFVCSENKLRSPTAEHHFSQFDGIEALSAGTNSSADVTLSGNLVEWADIVFCMEKIHARKVRERYGRHLRGRIVCIDVPDRYSYMQPELVELLASRVRPHLR